MAQEKTHRPLASKEVARLARLAKQAESAKRVLRAYFSQPSSYPEYLGQRKTKWVHPGDILTFFSKTNPHDNYQAFVEQNDEASSVEPISSIVVDL